MIERLFTIFMGVVLVIAGIYMSNYAEYLIPAGALVIGWAIPHVTDISKG